MKKLMFLIILLFLFSCGGAQKEVVNYCNRDRDEVLKALKRCNLSLNYKFKECASVFEKGNIGNKESSEHCKESLKNISCENLKESRKDYKLPEEFKCFDHEEVKPTNKDICMLNYKYECKDNFYSCGKSALKGLCKKASEIYGSSESREIKINEKVFENYCSSSPDSDEIYSGKYNSRMKGLYCGDYIISYLEKGHCEDITEEPMFDRENRPYCRKITKKDICIENYKNYCREINLFCENNLKGICAKNDTELEKYCESTENADSDMDKNEEFSCISFGYYIDSHCEDITEEEFFDFRKNNWKTEASENYSKMCEIK